MNSQGTLYIVSTPIGNLGDITFHALEILQSVSTVYCEDTRKTRKLCSHYRLHTTLSSFHEHNALKKIPTVIGELKRGASVALVCDAGTPLVSDPGYKLVREAINEGIVVQVIPGPSSVLSALVVSGLPPHQFYFAGYPPVKKGKRKKFFAELENIGGTIIIFESPHRLLKTLETMMDVYGGEVLVATVKELTKIHESVYRGSLAEVMGALKEAGVKGEYTVVFNLSDK